MKKFNLEETKIGTGFTAPDAYFDNFSVVPPRTEHRMRTFGKPWMVAAAVAVLSLAIPLLNALERDNGHDAIEHYLVYSADIPHEMLIEQMDDSDIKALGAEFYILDPTQEDILETQNIEHLFY